MIKKLFYFLNVCVLIALLLACLSCYIVPAMAWPLSFLGLGFLFIVITVLVFLIAWALWRDMFVFVNLLALLLCYPFIRTVVGLHFGKDEEKGLKVMSYNVRNFDLYNWTGNKKTRDEIMGFIKKENPEVMCFQEFYSDDDFRNIECIRDSLGYKYHYFHVTYDTWYKNTEQMKWHHQLWGLAIFSKYEIRDTGTVAFDQRGNNQCIYADLMIQGKPLRVYTTHLQSIHLDYEDYDTIEELSENQNSSWSRIRHILRKMKHAYTMRGRQSEVVHRSLQSFAGQKIICGDFNDSPISYTYQTITGGMKDAFVEKGYGLGKTFVTKLDAFRIDFILAGPGIKVNSYRCPHQELSDHFPVIARISL
jgi:endonuclease/exonuclease/phosphatase family metal-dependent hydrolase